MKKTQLSDDGERMIPVHHKGKTIYGEHISRYQLVKDLAKDKLVLDIACGSGYGSSILASQATRVIGIDVNKKSIDYAKQNYSAKNITYLEGEATNIALDDNFVDMVVSFETIEHLDDYQHFIDEVHRVLKKDGLFVVSTPNDEQYIEDNPFHKHEFRYKELMTLLGKSFRNLKAYFQTIWLYTSILDETLQSKDWQKKVNTLATTNAKPEEAVYFIVLCSDGPLPGMEPVGAISEIWSPRQLQTEKKLTSQHIKALEATIDSLKQELREIKRSKAYRFSKKFEHLKLK